MQERVIALLKESPSILQTDVYKQFDPIVKKDIQSILYFLDKGGVITRTKSGSTYQIHLNG